MGVNSDEIPKAPTLAMFAYAWSVVHDAFLGGKTSCFPWRRAFSASTVVPSSHIPAPAHVGSYEDVEEEHLFVIDDECEDDAWADPKASKGEPGGAIGTPTSKVKRITNTMHGAWRTCKNEFTAKMGIHALGSGYSKSQVSTVLGNNGLVKAD